METFYLEVAGTEPLRQGDILYPIPKPIMPLKDLVLFEAETINWLLTTVVGGVAALLTSHI